MKYILIIILTFFSIFEIGCNQQKNNGEIVSTAHTDTTNSKDKNSNYPGDKGSPLDEVLPLENTFNNSVLNIKVVTTDSLIVGGWFTAHSKNNQAKYVSVINSDGQVNNPQPFEVNGAVYVVHILDDRSMLIGGDFTKFNNLNIGGLIKLNSDGSVDEKFNKNLGSGFDGSVRSIAHTRDQILIVGDFGRFNGSGFVRFIRLGYDGLPINVSPSSEQNSQPMATDPSPASPMLGSNPEDSSREIASSEEERERTKDQEEKAREYEKDKAEKERERAKDRAEKEREHEKDQAEKERERVKDQAEKEHSQESDDD